MPRYLRTELGVKGILLRRGRLLLLHRRDDLAVAPGLWDMPGGGVEVGDSLEDTLVREVREETGFAVRVGRTIHAQIVHTRTTTGRPLIVAVLFYECSTRAAGSPRLDRSEHTEYAWVAHDKLSDYPVPPDQAEAIRKALGRKAIAGS